MADNIKSSKITIGDDKAPIGKWYNEVFLKQKDNMGMHPLYKSQPKFPMIAKNNDFAAAFDQTKLWLKPELTLNEFIAFFMIFANETGGTFRPVAERGELPYFFQPKPKPNPKASYNTLKGNRKAGDQLVAWGKLDKDKDKDEVKLWNGEVWPKDSSDDIKKAVVECDFNKFRGRGVIQITGRSAYEANVNPSLGKKKCDDLTDAELTKAVCEDPKVYLPMVKSFFSGKQWQGWIAALNKDPPGYFDVGLHISGGKDYATLYEYRTTTLLEAITKAGYDAS